MCDLRNTTHLSLRFNIMLLNKPKTSAEEIEHLRVSHFRLNSLVQELRLEIAYYQGETKRLEWEKNVLKQDVDRLSSLFTGWLEELQVPKKPLPQRNIRSFIYDTEYLKAVVKYPCRPICDLLQLTDVMYVVTTCQPPFFIEVNSPPPPPVQSLLRNNTNTNTLLIISDILCSMLTRRGHRSVVGKATRSSA